VLFRSLYAGGGGGSNYGQGGQAGMQNCSFSGSIPLAWFADGGLSLKNANFYDTASAKPLVSMGGGGGSSIQDATHTASKGGNGGGIVIIITDTLQTNNNSSIISNGGPVLTIVTAGGAGGGAGGSLLLDINTYRNTVHLIAKGGKGGNSLGQLTGGGGGGGGGLHWYAGPSLSSSVVDTLVQGAGGNLQASNNNLKGFGGSTGGIMNMLRLPLNGFLFNSVTAKDTICAGQTAKLIHGSVPKGGSSYTYRWIESTDSVSWNPTTDQSSMVNLNSGVLTKTTWFTRIITSGTIVDTAIPEKVYVYKAVTNNLLTNRDTLCYNTSPGILIGNPVGGGDSIYSYLWQSKTSALNWSSRGVSASLPEGKLLTPTYYRRIVVSAKVCHDTSNVDTITVLPLITNNDFSNADTAICAGLTAGVIRPLIPHGGDSTYSYQWLNGVTNSPIGGATQPNYSPGILNSDQYYKRVVYSGLDNVCKDTTSPRFYVQVYPALGTNTISTDSTRYCAGDIPRPITGSTPTGGNSPSYLYTWQKRLLNDSWQPIIGSTGKDYTPVTIFTDTVWISRIVTSGRFNACVDRSDSLKINIIPYIQNSLIPQDTSICEGSTPNPFTEVAATGGAGSYIYLWQYKPQSSSSWQPAPHAPNNLPSYTSGSLTETTLFRRQVSSQICTSLGNILTMTVYPHISRNIIQGGNIQYVCNNSSKSIIGLVPSGGNPLSSPVYLWQHSVDEGIWSPADPPNNTQNYNSLPLSDSSYFRRIVSSGSHNECNDTTSAVLIRIKTLPTGSIESKTDSLCAGANVSITYSVTGKSPWKLTLGDGTFTHTEDGIDNVTGMIVFPLLQSSAIKILELVDDSMCLAATSSLTGLVNAVVIKVPVAYAGTDGEICDLTYTMAARLSEGSGIWKVTAGSGIFDNPANPTAKFTSADYGTDNFRWVETKWHCKDSADISVAFEKQPLKPDVGPDVALDYTFTYFLTAQPPADGTGLWQSLSGNDSILDPSLPNSEVHFSTPGDYVFKWTVQNGVCQTESDTLGIHVSDLKIYNGFSPNGDGRNEEFILKLSGRYTATLIILDSWGGEVLTTTGVDEVRWDGNNKNGNPVPEGTYYFILKEPGVAERTGYIELRR
jgi:gliding motility-associated-like protein